MKKLKLLANVLLISSIFAATPASALKNLGSDGKIGYIGDVVEFRQAVESSKSDKDLFRIMTNIEKILKIHKIMPENSEDLLKLKEVYVSLLKKLNMYTLSGSGKGMIVYPCSWDCYESDCCDQNIVKLRMSIKQLGSKRKRVRVFEPQSERKKQKHTDDDSIPRTPRLVSQDFDVEIEDFVL